MEYEAHFYKFYKHPTSVLTIEFERVHYFVQGLRHLLRMSTQILVLWVGLLFLL